MNSFRVSDFLIEDVTNASYDRAFFASGYEKRCTHVARQLNPKNIQTPYVLGFKELDKSEQRIENDKYFKDAWNCSPLIISADDESEIYNLLNSSSYTKGQLKIIADYSSMSRLWYAGILNWARFSPNIKEVIVDLLYSVGEHQDSTHPMVINQILSIPGLEGGPVPLSKSVAIFGLGFDGASPLCVLDRLEPDVVYSYVASPAAFNEYPQITYKQNSVIINKHARATIELPLNSVEMTYIHLAELVSQHQKDSDITIIPMGPKPHVLAAILLAMRFEEITCLRVGGKIEKTREVGTTGQIVCTRVHFKKQIDMREPV